MIRCVARVPLATAFAVIVFTGGACAQSKPGDPGHGNPAKSSPKPAPVAQKPIVPFFGNETCPIDGKPVLRDKFVEVPEGSDAIRQRVYVCSDRCAELARKDPKAAAAKAFAKVTPVVSKGCATCGVSIETGKSKELVFEGRRVLFCSAGCEAQFQKSPWLWLARLTWPDARDAKNVVDPVDGKPVDPAVLAIYRKQIVHFSSPKNVATFEKDPESVMAKVKTPG